MLFKKDFSGNITKDILDVNGFDEIDFDFMNYDGLYFNPINSKKLVDFIGDAKDVIFCSDVDADGLTSACVVKCYYPNAKFIFGDRSDRGLTKKIVEDIHLLYQAKKIVTLDCGITNFNGINEANSLGISVFVTDHHQPENSLPNCYDIINPWVGDYEFKEFCGAGIIYSALSSVFGRNDDALQFAAIGTVCDLMPLIKDNRYIVSEGLKLINSNTAKSIQMLIKSIKVRFPIDVKTIGWFIGPTINSASRLEKTYIAVDALLNENEESAIKLNKLNSERKIITSRAVETAQVIDKDGVAIVFINVDSLGVSGLVATKLAMLYKKPVCVMTSFDDQYKGSIRTGELWSASELIQGCELIEGGGHFGAAGFSFDKQHKDHVIDYIINFANKKITGNYLLRKIYFADIKIKIEDAIRLYPEIKKLEPYGQGFHMPKFGSIAVIDSKKFKITSGKNWSFIVDNARAFYYNPPEKPILDKLVWLCYDIEYDYWIKSPALMIAKMVEVGDDN